MRDRRDGVRSEGVDPWFLGPQLFAGLSGALLLLRARRAWLRTPATAAMGAAAVQTFLRPGPAPELYPRHWPTFLEPPGRGSYNVVLRRRVGRDRAKGTKRSDG